MVSARRFTQAMKDKREYMKEKRMVARAAINREIARISEAL